MRPQHGFTLIELVASAVLASMLMVGLMNVVWSAAQDTQQLNAAERTRASVVLLCDQLRSDFQNARGMITNDRGVTLHGFLAQDPSTLESTLQLANVQYDSRWNGSHQILTRRYSDDENRSAENVWVGFGRLRIEPLAEVDSEDKLRPTPAAGGLPLIPLSFRVTMTNDQGYILWREVIHHREG